MTGKMILYIFSNIVLKLHKINSQVGAHKLDTLTFKRLDSNPKVLDTSLQEHPNCDTYLLLIEVLDILHGS